MAQGIAGSFGKALGRALAAGAEAAVRSLLRSPSKRTPTSPRPARRDDEAQQPRSGGPARTTDRTTNRTTDRTTDRPPARTADGYPGDFTGRAVIEYRPDPDGQADPGEVVWGWVPFEEDHSQGKDRPVLVIGRDGDWLLGLMLTSKDHDRDAAQEARNGRQWTDVGTGPWDPKRRPSEVRLDRVLRLDPAAVRREGGTMPRSTFDAVAEQVRAVNGWG